VKAMRSDLRFCDIRGIIEKRLEKLWDHTVDGVVIAEAALIRLGLTHLNRITIPGEVAAYQGQLAIVARSGDTEMREIFAPLDCRTRELYLGIDRPAESLEVYRHHIPMIEIVPLPVSKPDFSSFTHVVFTSKTAVRLFFSSYKAANLTYIAVGKATAKAIEKEGAFASLVAENEQAEGIISLLEHHDLSQAHLYWPHSALARPVLLDFFRKAGIKCTESILYTTRPRRPDPLPDPSKYESLFFTSPSTVDAFVSLYGKIPSDKILRCQGNITKNRLDDLIKSLESKRMTLITS
jgi:hydroxymethylbilane synthase